MPPKVGPGTKRRNPLTPGDVLSTHPAPGFWGCAVVLTARDATAGMHPASHVGITSLLRQRPVTWQDVEAEGLALVRREVRVRVGSHDYRQQDKPVTCIGIYTVPAQWRWLRLGSLDPAHVWPHKLAFAPGDGTGRRFPLCGPLDDALGMEAVLAWRAIHDAQALASEQAENDASFERYEAQRLGKDRAARAARAKRVSERKP